MLIHNINKTGDVTSENLKALQPIIQKREYFLIRNKF